MHLPMSPLSGGKRTGPDMEARNNSPSGRNGKTRRRGLPSAGPPVVTGGQGKPYVIECSHPANRVVPRFSTSDYISGEQFVVGYCHNCRLHVTTPAPDEEQLARYYPSS